ncbi:MAG: tetratricopeptide repeat protein [Verrucomicrobiia bacterium]
MTRYKWLAWPVAVVLACGCAGLPRSGPAPTPAPPYYQEALRAYWGEDNPAAFVLASLAVEKDPDPQHIEHAGYLATVLASEKLSVTELKEVTLDARIAHLMLDVYARGLRASKTNDYAQAFRAFRDFTFCTPSERWRRIGLTTSVPPNWARLNSPGESDQNLRLAELALKLAPDPTTAGQIAEAASPATAAQKARAAEMLAAVFERTGELRWSEKAFALLLEAQQPARAETLALRILTNDSATVSTYVSLGTAYTRAGRLTRAEEVLTAAIGRFGNRHADITLAQAELYRRQQRYDDALNELLTAGREVEQFRREHYHPVWAKQLEAVALATGPDDSVYAITGETKPRVLHLSRDGEVLAQYGPFEDPTDDGAHPFAVFNDGTFLIRNRRWSSDGRMLQEFPFSPSIRAVCVDRGQQRVLAFGRTEGIKILSADGQLLSHLCGDGSAWTPCNNFCPCVAIAANEESILLVTRNGPVRLDYKGGYSGPWEGGGFHDVAAGRDGLFYLSRGDQVKVVRVAPFNAWQSMESIPHGGGAIAAATSGGFYVAGVTTEQGIWLIKYAPPIAPRE